MATIRVPEVGRVRFRPYPSIGILRGNDGFVPQPAIQADMSAIRRSPREPDKSMVYGPLPTPANGSCAGTRDPMPRSCVMVTKFTRGRRDPAVAVAVK